MAVHFDRVTFRYPGRELGPGRDWEARAGLFDIDLEVKDGELLAVIGPSGSGKSTLLMLLAGFLEPESGEIRIDGRSVTGLPPQQRNLGIVFQSYALFQHMNAVDNVAYPLKVRAIARERRRGMARAALARVGLEGFAERQPQSLSGGQQQRVALARALVFQPSALLLDEPLSALDAALRAEMRDEILRVQREARIATLHVTHDQEEALSIADRVAVMWQGRLVQVATPRQLYDRPVDRTVAAFVGQANLWDGTVAAPGAVETALGRLVCDTGMRQPGEPVTVLVRPENVRPLTAADVGLTRTNVFSGSVTRDRFLGAARRYDFQVAGTVVLGETRLRDSLDAISIPPDAIRLLPPPTSDPQGEVSC